MLKPKYIENILSITKESAERLNVTLFANVAQGILLDIKTLSRVPQKKRHTRGHTTPLMKNTVASDSVTRTVFLTFTE